MIFKKKNEKEKLKELFEDMTVAKDLLEKGYLKDDMEAMSKFVSEYLKIYYRLEYLAEYCSKLEITVEESE